MPCAFAMVIGIPVKTFISRVGHDGSEVTKPQEQGYLKRRGFTVEECLEVCKAYGYAFEDGGLGVFEPRGKGVLFLKKFGTGVGHAVAFRSSVLYDPTYTTGMHSIEMAQRSFSIMGALYMQRLH